MKLLAKLFGAGTAIQPRADPPEPVALTPIEGGLIAWYLVDPRCLSEYCSRFPSAYTAMLLLSSVHDELPHRYEAVMASYKEAQMQNPAFVVMTRLIHRSEP